MASFGSHVLHFHKIGKDELVYLRKCSDLPSIKMTQFIAHILHVPVKPVERAKARGDDCCGLQQLSTEMPRCRCKSGRRVEGCLSWDLLRWKGGICCRVGQKEKLVCHPVSDKVKFVVIWEDG